VAAAATAAAAVADAIAGKRSERTFEHEKRHSNVAFFVAPDFVKNHYGSN
jgi:hypothetical protein